EVGAVVGVVAAAAGADRLPRVPVVGVEAALDLVRRDRRPPQEAFRELADRRRDQDVGAAGVGDGGRVAAPAGRRERDPGKSKTHETPSVSSRRWSPWSASRSSAVWGRAAWGSSTRRSTTTGRRASR